MNILRRHHDVHYFLKIYLQDINHVPVIFCHTNGQFGEIFALLEVKRLSLGLDMDVCASICLVDALFI
jgi:hypothetical protein